MKVVLAEKPSVARDLARNLKATSRKDGYYEGNGYKVTWAFGHLVGLKDFQDYDSSLKRWSLDTLPYIPEKFELKVIGDKSSRHQFSIIKTLFKSASEIICATDAGREGELIFRNIQILTGAIKKPFYRLWLSSLTDEAIRKGLQSLVPGQQFDPLFHAARSRSQADWIVGLNATRNYTLRYGKDKQLWSVGRVQTPVLAMIVRRDDEIRSFRSEKFWVLHTMYRETLFKHTEHNFKSVENGEKVLQQVLGRTFTIANISSQKRIEKPPLLHDLTEIQREMNRRYGLSAAYTLKIVQKLYENKLITYPRTDSRYLSSDIKSTIPKTLNALSQIKQREIARLNLKNLPFTNRIIADNKVTDHHAIIPTGKIRNLDDEVEGKVYDAILTRFMAVFYPNCVKNVTTVDGMSNSVLFTAKGITIISAGWTELYPKAKKRESEKLDLQSKNTVTLLDDRQRDSEDDKDDAIELPPFQKNESGPHDPFLKERATQPPKHYSENTLLSAMETAGKMVDIEELKEALKEKGIGTPATRASIIELLISRNYIERKKKTLLATDAGRYLISIIRNTVLKSPELTGEWEHQLKQIEKGKRSSEGFMEDIISFTHEILRSSGSIQVNHSRLGHCPKCQRTIIQGKKGYGCSGWKDGCDYVLWMDYKGHRLTPTEARELLQTGRLENPITIAEGNSSRQILVYLGELGQVLEISFQFPHQPTNR